MPHWTRESSVPRTRLDAILGGRRATCAVSSWRHFPVDDQETDTLAESTLAYQRQVKSDLVKLTPASTWQLLDHGVTDCWEGDPIGRRRITRTVIHSPDEWYRLEPQPADQGFRARIVAAAGRVREQLPDTIPVLATLFNPLFLAVGLSGWETFRRHWAQAPEAVAAGLEILAADCAELVAALSATGVDGIYLAIQHAGADHFTPGEYRALALPTDRAVLANMTGLPLSMLHLHGERVHLDLFSAEPVSFLHYDWTAPGNPPPETVYRPPGCFVATGPAADRFVHGQPEDILAEVQDLQARMAGRSWLLAPGCAIPLDAPAAPVKALHEALRSRRSPLQRSREKPLPLDHGGPIAHSYTPFPEPDRIVSVAHRFAHIAAGFGERFALDDGVHRWTYRELQQEVRRLAQAVAAAVPGGSEPIAILLPHDARLPMAMLAILAAGRGYVPLDPGFPRDRNRLILGQAEAAAIVLDSTHFRTALDLGVEPERIIDIDAIAPTADVAPRPASGFDLAYVLYTSGSTGTPKGVYQNQRNLLHDIMQFTNAAHIGPGDRLTLLYSGSVNGAIRDIYGALLNGAELHPLSIHALGIDGVVRAIRERRITVLHAVPTVFRLIVSALGENERLESVRLVYLAGDRVDHGDVAAFRRHFYEGSFLYTGIGSTENATLYRHWFIDHGTPLAEGRLPVGRTLPDRPIRIVDEAGESLPVGKLGEIETSSRYLALGYWKNPELTAATFQASPDDPEARRFRTGDLGRIRPDGLLEFFGRKDQQVKIRGKRVELPEIEAALAAHPAIDQAIVLCREDVPGHPRLAAYYVARPGVVLPQAPELRGYLARGLPEHMIPSAFVALAAFPLTPTRKIDRKALPTPAFDGEAADYQAPRTAKERVLTEILAEVLHRPRVGINDNFFELGGHSLLMLRALVRIQERLGVALSLLTLFEAPTVAGLAPRIESNPGSQNAPPPPPIPPVAGDSWPLSFAQQRLWMLERLLPLAGVYHIPWALRFQGRLNTAALEAALQLILARQSALRTGFADPDGIPQQVIEAGLVFHLPVESLLALPEGERESEALRRLRADALEPFDLRAGPLVRGRVLRISEQEHIVGLTLHHIVADGGSLLVLARELGLAYSAACQGEAPRWQELPIRYADFAVWQRECLNEAARTSLVDHWRHRLAGLEPLELPTDRPRPAQFSHRGEILRFVVPAALRQPLESLVRKEQATLFMGLLAVCQILLARHARQEDFAVGTPIAGRNRSELEGLVGFFANTLVLRAELQGHPGFRDLLRRVRTTALDAYAHQDLPFETLVEELNPPRDLGRNPLFQVLFLFQNLDAIPQLPGLVATRLDVHNGTAKFDLTLAFRGAGGTLEGSIEYAADLFDRERIERLAGHYLTLLEAALAAPECPVFELPLLHEEEQRQLRDWNLTEAPFPRDHTLADLFGAQVARSPDAVALEFGDCRYTYRELNRQANRLAHWLIGEHGVGPGAAVGLCVGRSADLIVGLLAILKVGAACVPLDPDYPEERLRIMLEDSGTALVLTETRLRALLPAGAAVLVSLEDAAVAGPEADLPPRSKPDDLAYVIHTSGSTGRPKGIAMPHRAIVNLLAWQLRQDGFSTPARTLQYSPIGFDVSFQEIFSCFLSGGTLVLVDEATRRDSVALLAFLESRGIERLFLPFVALQTLATVARGSWPAALREVVTAGEQLQASAAVVAAFRHSAARLHNHYGPSETHVVTTHALVTDVDAWPLLPPIGRPIDNVRAYVLDARLQPVPVGVAGELCIAGVALAHGYLKQAVLTAERFVELELLGRRERVYRSGDLARWRPDGTLEFLGRIDRQVKIRGFRIEPGEIETILSLHPAVREAVVLPVAPRAGDERLVAYVRSDQPGLARVTLEAHLAERLPRYMLPSAFVIQQTDFPLSPNGKIDRVALPLPEWGPSNGPDRPTQAPATVTEKVLVSLWEALLQVEPIGRTDDFFELGGHSLLAAELMNLIEKAFGRRLPLDTLWFQESTIAGLAAALDKNAAAWPMVVDLRTGRDGPPLFCAPLIGGNLFEYYALAQHLDPNQAVCGLQVRGLEPGKAARYSIPDIARDCIDAMRSRQSRGPYYLAGYSAGGLVAYEMARQLRASGEEVPLLALLDTSPRLLRPDFRPYRHYLRGIMQLLGLSGLPGTRPDATVERGEFKETTQKIYWLTRQMGKHVLKQRPWYFQWLRWRTIHALGLGRFLAPPELPTAHRYAVATYRPQPCADCNLLFIKPDRSNLTSAPDDWRRLSNGAVTVIEIPGDHRSIMKDPQVAVLADVLQGHLCTSDSKGKGW